MGKSCLDLVSINRIPSLEKTAFWPNFDQSGPNNSQPISQMGTYQDTEVIESYLMIWGQYDPIKSSLSEPQKMWVIWV